MKIAILVSMFPPKWFGGAEIASQNIARYLSRGGHDIHIITSFDKGLLKESQEDNFFIHRISYPKIKFLGVIFFWVKCLFLLKKINPEVAHSQSIQMGFPCFLVKKLFDIPYVIYCHGSDVYLPWKFKKIISKLVIKNAAAVVVLTNNMKDEIKKNYDRNVLVIPNGIDSEKFKNLSQEKIRDELNIKQNETIIIFIGTLKPVKGVQYLIEAMEILRQKNLDVKLLLIGDGKEKQNLEKLVKKLKLEKHVKFIGKIQNEEIPKYMALSNIFVLPSLSEGFPLTILEAMACGLPIVTTMVRGIPEVVEDGENGFLVEPKNPKEIAEKVLLLLKDDKLREKISNNNKEKAKKYSWENVVEKLEKVYLKVLNKKL